MTTFGSFRDAFGYIVFNAIELNLGNHRSDLSFLGLRIAHQHLFRHPLCDGLDGLEFLGRHQHARRRIARLSGILKHMHHTAFTARSKSASSSNMLGDLPPSSWWTRLTVAAAVRATSVPARVEPVNDTMSTSGCPPAPADLSPGAVDEIEYARWHARFSQYLGPDHRAERRELRRLQNHCAASSQRRHDLGRNLIDRPVPRRDQRAHADRLEQQARWATTLFELKRRQQVDHRGGVPRRSPIA
jgi:hypothetical protein